MSVTVISLTIVISFVGVSDRKIAGENVGIIEIIGTISESKNIIDNLKAFRENDAIKAIVLRIDSPGGAVGPSQEIYQEVRKTTEVKSVIVSMGALAASGGYYIAAGANGIVANPGTITGSIGVIMGFTNFQQLLEKIGLVPVVIKSGEFKDIGSPAREMTPAEQQLLQNVIDDIHQQFITAISDGRKMEIARIEPIADGRLITGKAALSLGLVDRLGNLEDAVEWAGSLGGIEGEISTVYPEKEKLPLLRYLLSSALNPFFSQFLENHFYIDYRLSPEPK
ncbi:MAG: signal peptide peptidase SppA [Desulfobacteraceae bacterium]|nr:signal peptide peptidase SppA [Desulfobacteraceae bacterium]